MFAAASLAAICLSALPAASAVRYEVRDVKTDFQTDERALFTRPVAVTHTGEAVYVMDADYNEISVFGKDGRFIKAFGRKGAGPVEFNAPSAMDIVEDNLYICDTINGRIQIVGKGGAYRGGFPVPFDPQQICVLGEDRIVLSHIPMGFDGREPMIHCYSGSGELLWEALDSYYTGDRVYDAFRNFLVLVHTGGDSVSVVRKSDERVILRFDSEGRALSPVRVSEEYAFKKLTIPVKGPRKHLQGFCWDATAGRGMIGLLTMDYTPEKDLGPGRSVHLIDFAGKVEGVIEFPSLMLKVDLDGDRIYAIDAEYRLRVFSWGKP